jgi:hypothetical protein
VSLDVFSSRSSPETHGPSGKPLATLETVDDISWPSKLELTGSDEATLIYITLEQICLCCGGAGSVPVTLSETCSSCNASGYEFIEGGRQPCAVCDGTCWVPIEEMEQCERCDGTGLELTRAGRRLLRRSGSELWIFLNRWRGRRVGVTAAITDAIGVAELAESRRHVEVDELPRGQE